MEEATIPKDLTREGSRTIGPWLTVSCPNSRRPFGTALARSAAEAPLRVHGRMTFKEHTLVVSGGREHHVARVIIDQTPSV